MMNFDINEFNKLVGKEFTTSELSEKLPMLGTPVERIEGNEIEVEVFPNRPDMLSVEGLARTFSGFIGIDTGMKKYSAKESEYEVEVDPAIEDVRPFIACAIVKNLKLDDYLIKSLMQIQEKLHITHCRKRATASIGVYDLDKIEFPVRYMLKEKNFKFVPLEFKEEMKLSDILKIHPKGKDYGWILENFSRYPILIDSKNMVLSMPPIINSEDSKVDENTKNLFIDVTGTDYKTVNEVLNIIATALVDRGGELYSVKISGLAESFTPILKPRTMRLSIGYANKLLGLNLSDKEIISLLEKMRFDAIETPDPDDFIEVTIPPYRADIMHPIDLVEEIAIAYGYEKFEPEIPKISTIGSENDKEIFYRRLRELIVGFGFQEVINYILTNEGNLFDRMNIEREKDIAKIMNSKSSEYNVCRNWITPSLMKTFEVNKHNSFPQKIFEIGTCIKLDSSEENGVKTEKRLGIAFSQDGANLSYMKSLLVAFFKNIGLDVEIKPSSHKSFVEGRYGEIFSNNICIGFFGEIHPKVLANWNLELPVVTAEIYLDYLKI